MLRRRSLAGTTCGSPLVKSSGSTCPQCIYAGGTVEQVKVPPLLTGEPIGRRVGLGNMSSSSDDPDAGPKGDRLYRRAETCRRCRRRRTNADQRLGAEGDGFKIVIRVTVAAKALSVARACFEDANYAKIQVNSRWSLSVPRNIWTPFTLESGRGFADGEDGCRQAAAGLPRISVVLVEIACRSVLYRKGPQTENSDRRGRAWLQGCRPAS